MVRELQPVERERDTYRCVYGFLHVVPSLAAGCTGVAHGYVGQQAS